MFKIHKADAIIDEKLLASLEVEKVSAPFDVFDKEFETLVLRMRLDRYNTKMLCDSDDTLKLMLALNDAKDKDRVRFIKNEDGSIVFQAFMLVDKSIDEKGIYELRNPEENITRVNGTRTVSLTIEKSKEETSFMRPIYVITMGITENFIDPYLQHVIKDVYDVEYIQLFQTNRTYVGMLNIVDGKIDLEGVTVVENVIGFSAEGVGFAISAETDELEMNKLDEMKMRKEEEEAKEETK